jgi:hypothetical protein
MGCPRTAQRDILLKGFLARGWRQWWLRILEYSNKTSRDMLWPTSPSRSFAFLFARVGNALGGGVIPSFNLILVLATLKKLNI